MKHPHALGYATGCVLTAILATIGLTVSSLWGFALGAVIVWAFMEIVFGDDDVFPR